MMNKQRKGCWWLVITTIAIFFFPFIWRVVIVEIYERQIFSPATVPPEQVAVVFGAAVYGDRLSSVLRDRMDTAITLYEQGKVAQLLVSGGDNEPAAMRAYAIRRGVAAADIIEDAAGQRTYDTCYRAAALFEVKSAVLVTQDFHLPRALFTCRALGIDAVGIGADLRPYRAARFYEVRETAATLVALWDVIRRQPATIMDVIGVVPLSPSPVVE